MIATNAEEALLNLFHICQRAARTFSRCADRSRSAPLRAALAARSQHCRQVAGGLRPFLKPARTRVVPHWTEWKGPPADATEADLLRVYEVCEGYVLASYRDLIDLGLPPALSALLLPQFEQALHQYVDIVAEGVSLRSAPGRSMAAARREVVRTESLTVQLSQPVHA